ncbi:DUF418 domain-containing protein [Sphingosinicella sp. BN140058]|uniref:DUF418 domain-containing protein n=1 Tax=Sphingosinicella sp. BN140058 TaxID=1892855 RepID=UPI00101071B9|nr:DUF418 domain-containing protein [Sphingosinicella sp. BN140058]QAY78693.1 DUF418 domain-containing protein [Sphingosinicella sp. BN140058]
MNHHPQDFPSAAAGVDAQTATGHRVDAPTVSARRAAHIDALRALALLGVIVMNIGSMVMAVNGRATFAAAGPADIAAAAFDLIVFQGKARSCFAFLFGAGFAILMLRSEARGGSFAAFYARRMLALLGFGVVNQIFLFWGDILVTYAILGLLLIFARHWTHDTLLRAGLALVLLPPLAASAFELVTGAPIPNLIQSSPPTEAAASLAAYTSPSYADAVARNIAVGLREHGLATGHMLVYDLGVLGLFLLGAYAVRSGLLTGPQAHRRTLRRLAATALPLGLALSVVNSLPFLGIRSTGAAHAAVTAAYVGVPILAFGYLAAFALLFTRRPRPGRIHAFLAATGRMTLTNYLVSGALGCWLFYGYGLAQLDRFNLAALSALSIALFLALATLSNLWLTRFRQGPAEWLSRVVSPPLQGA